MTEFSFYVHSASSSSTPIAGFINAEDAADFVAMMFAGYTIRSPGGVVLWTEGAELSSSKDRPSLTALVVRERLEEVSP